jgi:hypothetical protein
MNQWKKRASNGATQRANRRPDVHSKPHANWHENFIVKGADCISLDPAQMPGIKTAGKPVLQHMHALCNG